ncbi:MAG TPA: hypothetical protein VGM41_21880 [Chitinophagaceae bacterium]|jgi:hypothetical protein
MKYNTICFALLILVSSGLAAQTKKSPYRNLEGKWVSRQDPHYTIDIKNGWLIESRQSAKRVDSFRYEISGKPCGAGAVTGKKTLFIHLKDKKGNNEHCCKLLSYTSNAFSYSTADNKTLRFIRYIKRY